MPQLHVDLPETQLLLRFKHAVKVLGYVTMSAYIRVCILNAIKDAEKIAQEGQS